MNNFNVGTVPFINALPLIYYINEFIPEANVIQAPPSQLLKPLLANEIQIALLPIIDIFNENLLFLPTYGIASKKHAESVILIYKNSLYETKSLICDPSSKSSNALAQIILHQKYNRHNILLSSNSTLDEYSAMVLIGDEALNWINNNDNTELHFVDLAEEWFEITQHSFIFAAWAFLPRNKDLINEFSTKLTLTAKKGLQNIKEISNFASRKIGLPEEYCNYYLSSCIQFPIGKTELRGAFIFKNYLSKLSNVCVAK